MHSSRSILSGIALVALAGSVALAQGTMSTSKMGNMAAAKPVTVEMKPENNSGESGTATLTQVGPDVQVKIALTGAPANAQPAHIHEGTCAKLNPTPKYPLTNVEDGKSTTVVKNLKLSTLTSGTFAVNVHKSAPDAKVYFSCGEIK